MLYKGEISLHFDPHSRHSCRTRSLLLWVLIRIPTSGLSVCTKGQISYSSGSESHTWKVIYSMGTGEFYHGG